MIKIFLVLLIFFLFSNKLYAEDLVKTLSDAFKRWSYGWNEIDYREFLDGRRDVANKTLRRRWTNLSDVSLGYLPCSRAQVMLRVIPHQTSEISLERRNVASRLDLEHEPSANAARR